MNWKSKETITVYEHYFDFKKHLETQEQFFVKMEKETENYLRNKKIVHEENLTSSKSNSISESPTKEPLDFFFIRTGVAKYMNILN